MDPEDESTAENLEIIRNSTDAKGRPLIPILVHAPDYNKVRKSLIVSQDSAIGYCNYYVCNKAVIVPYFGDEEADNAAFDTFTENYPGRTIEFINIDNIVNGGGSVHCAT